MTEIDLSQYERLWELANKLADTDPRSPTHDTILWDFTNAVKAFRERMTNG